MRMVYILSKYCISRLDSVYRLSGITFQYAGHDVDSMTDFNTSVVLLERRLRIQAVRTQFMLDSMPVHGGSSRCPVSKHLYKGRGWIEEVLYMYR